MSEGSLETLGGEAVVPVFKRLLLVTDFSEPSIAAAPFARLVAEYYHARVVVVHVIPAEPKSADTPPAQASADSSRDAAEAQMREFVSAHELREFLDETVIGEGSVWETIAALVEQKHIDLVVLGTHGRSGVGKLLMGSVAQRIFSLAPCPVLTVSPKARTTWGPDHRLARILYATDFSTNSLNALPYALSLAKVSHAELLLLHVPESSAPSSPEIIQGYHQHLNALIPTEDRNWCASDTLVESGDPGRVIVSAAAKYNVDFVVIGAHAIEGALTSFQVPLSIAYRVVAHAHCPVLRVRS
jgi:nucleotide-binding universal stress UspA family protein